MTNLVFSCLKLGLNPGDGPGRLQNRRELSVLLFICSFDLSKADCWGLMDFRWVFERFIPLVAYNEALSAGFEAPLWFSFHIASWLLFKDWFETLGSNGGSCRRNCINTQLRPDVILKFTFTPACIHQTLCLMSRFRSYLNDRSKWDCVSVAK